MPDCAFDYFKRPLSELTSKLKIASRWFILTKLGSWVGLINYRINAKTLISIEHIKGAKISVSKMWPSGVSLCKLLCNLNIKVKADTALPFILVSLLCTVYLFLCKCLFPCYEIHTALHLFILWSSNYMCYIFLEGVNRTANC